MTSYSPPSMGSPGAHPWTFLGGRRSSGSRVDRLHSGAIVRAACVPRPPIPIPPGGGHRLPRRRRDGPRAIRHTAMPRRSPADGTTGAGASAPARYQTTQQRSPLLFSFALRLDEPPMPPVDEPRLRSGRGRGRSAATVPSGSWSLPVDQRGQGGSAGPSGNGPLELVAEGPVLLTLGAAQSLARMVRIWLDEHTDLDTGQDCSP